MSMRPAQSSPAVSTTSDEGAGAASAGGALTEVRMAAVTATRPRDQVAIRAPTRGRAGTHRLFGLRQATPPRRRPSGRNRWPVIGWHVSIPPYGGPPKHPSLAE